MYQLVDTLSLSLSLSFLISRRHTLKLHMTGTYGYHIAVYSNTKFTLTDEDGVLPLLSTVRHKEYNNNNNNYINNIFIS